MAAATAGPIKNEALASNSPAASGHYHHLCVGRNVQETEKPHSLRKSRAVAHLLTWLPLLPAIQTQRRTAQFWLQSPHIDGLQPFGSLFDRELDFLVFIQRTESFTFDARVMDEYVVSGFTGDETISFGIIEPFDGSGLSFTHLSYSLIDVNLAKQWGKIKKDPPVSASLDSPLNCSQNLLLHGIC
jgi:hypothetical protein